MAISKALIASILISLLVLQLSEADQLVNNNGTQVNNNGTQGTLSPKIDCGGACAVRCSLSSRFNLCKRACGSCCSLCSCVPPGTSGNLEVCPCYANITTRDNKSKCP